MGILDEAIREHLELKRQHGADQSELQKLEDEAFGPPGRPGEEGSDTLAEAPTEFMAQPEAETGERDRGEASADASQAPSGRSESAARIADLQEGPERPSAAGEAAEEAPDAETADEEPSATEHEIVSEPAPSGPTTEEREVIAEQPTEMHDVEEELAEEGDVQGEADVVDLEEDEDDDFWDEKRLSDELDQALEAPADSAEGEQELSGEVEPAEDTETAEAEEPEAETPSASSEDEDVLEETPEFLEQSPEDDELWFEQKPPKDFDFDD
jgi:hypothetical protein